MPGPQEKPPGLARYASVRAPTRAAITRPRARRPSADPFRSVPLRFGRPGALWSPREPGTVPGRELPVGIAARNARARIGAETPPAARFPRAALSMATPAP